MNSMKKLVNLLLVSFVILSLTGCSKPSEELPNNDNVVGDIESSKENDEDKTANNDVTKDENTSNKEEVNNTQSDKPVTPNKNNNTSSIKNEPSKNNTVTHTHEWAEVYEIVKHDEIGHYETVVVQEAWDEVIVIQEAWDEKVIDQHYIEPTLILKPVCYRCGSGLVGGKEGDKCIMRDCGGILANQPFYVGGQEEISHIVHHDAVTETIHHESVKEDKWVVDQQAYEEKVVAGYKCSKCGEFKQ